MRTKMAVVIAAGLLASSVASIAQAATSLDSNLAYSAIVDEVDIGHGAASAPELAADPDPNVAPTTAIEEVRIGDVDQHAPEIASAPDSNLVAFTID
jgi:hypothetical protein